MLPIIVCAFLFAFVFVYPGIDVIIWAYTNFWRRILSRMKSYSYSRSDYDSWEDKDGKQALNDYDYEDVKEYMKNIQTISDPPGESGGGEGRKRTRIIL